MKKISTLLLALGIASASLSSCSRSNYAFNPATPAYLGSEPAKVATHKAPEAAPAAVAVAPVQAATPAPAPAPAVAAAPKAESLPGTVVAAAPAAKAIKPNFAQRIALKSLAKQLNKLQDKKQATAGTDKTASKAGRAALFAAAGLALLILGIIIAAAGSLGVGVALYIVGGILFTVFAIIAIVYLVSGK